MESRYSESKEQTEAFHFHNWLLDLPKDQRENLFKLKYSTRFYKNFCHINMYLNDVLITLEDSFTILTVLDFVNRSGIFLKRSA